MNNNLPTHLVTEVFIIKDLILSSCTAILNVHINDTFNLLENLDERLNNGKITLLDCSRQVQSSYLLYLKYLPIINENQYNKYER